MILHSKHLLIEVDGDNLEKLYKDCGLIENVLKSLNVETFYYGFII